jgi:hypothetical protein
VSGVHDLMATQETLHRGLVNQVAEALRKRLTCPVYLNAQPVSEEVAKPYVVVGRGRYHVGPAKSTPGQADIVIAHHMANPDDAAQITATQQCLRLLSTRTIQQVVLTDTNAVSETLRLDTFGVHHVNEPYTAIPSIETPDA